MSNENLKNLKKSIDDNNSIGQDFISTSTTNFNLFEIEKTEIKEKESISLKVDVELLDKIRAIAEVKNKTVLELLEIMMNQCTQDIETQLPDYKQHAESYKKRFEKRRGPRAKTTKKSKNNK